MSTTRRALLLSQQQARLFHATSSCGAKYNNAPGQGGASEERHIGTAIRTLRDQRPAYVMEVMNACHVNVASNHLPARRILNDFAQVWIRVLTHSDLLSPEALQYQIEQASRLEYGPSNRPATVPVMAVSLKDVESLKTKQLKPLMELIVGAFQSAPTTQRSSMAVCGLPNAGKSSLIYPLTRARTLEVRKKKGHHLPKINAKAGWTLGTKNHAFEYQRETFSLTDTPGLRLRMDDMSPLQSAYLIATGSMVPPKGMLSNNEELRAQIVTILWRGLKRHADLSASSSSIPFDSPDDLWKVHCDDDQSKSTSPVALMHSLIRWCGQGRYGGLVIEEEGYQGISANSRLSRPKPDQIIAGMNEEAKILRNVGAGNF